MRTKILAICCFAILTVTFDSHAEGVASVEVFQSPAWLIRDNVRSALALGTEIQENDEIETGASARAMLRLGDGSTVKLGAHASLVLPLLDAGGLSDGVFLGFLDLAKGAFRFTTTELGKLHKREITAQLRSITIGIRGTDVWGKADDARDFVVLLEGQITVDHNDQSYPLDEALSLFSAPIGASPEPITEVNQDDLALWAQETEPQDGAGVRAVDGKVRLHLATYADESRARALVNRLDGEGYQVSVDELDVGGRKWFHVSQQNFVTRADAFASRTALQSLGGLAGAWLDRE
ncbi:MAG: hypothetical protein ACI9BW_002728 [Gammaproteobacteria bacterium]|jgi:hypothetical protein